MFYYERSEALGDRFLEAYLATLRRIAEHPRLGRVRFGHRQYFIPGFPYAIYVDLEAKEIVAGGAHRASARVLDRRPIAGAALIQSSHDETR